MKRAAIGSRTPISVGSSTRSERVSRSPLSPVMPRPTIRRSPLPPVHAPIQKIFGSIYLGNIVAIISRPGHFSEFESGLLIQSSYSRSRKHPKIAVVNSRHLSCRSNAVGDDGKQPV